MRSSFRNMAALLLFACLPTSATVAGEAEEAVARSKYFASLSIDEQILIEKQFRKECSGNPFAGAAFGSYGYEHCLLHKWGSVHALMAATGTGCCDGGKGGECRGTRIRDVQAKNGRFEKEAWLDGQWTMFHETIHTGISLPPGVQAMVCASKPWYEKNNEGEEVRRISSHCAAASTRA